MEKSSPLAPLVQDFTAAQAARLAHLSVDMVNYLSRYHVVEASGAGRRGRGCRRRYVYSDILILRVISRLLDNGISVLRLRKSLSALRERGAIKEVLVRRFVVTDGHDIFFQDGGVAELLESGQLSFAFVLELSALRKTVSEDIRLALEA